MRHRGPIGRFQHLLFVILALGLTFSPAAAQDAVTLPGASWSFVPPPDFKLVSQPIARMEHPRKILMIAQDAPKEPVSKDAIEKEKPAGGSILKVEDATIGGRPAVIFEATMKDRRATMLSAIIEGEASNGMIIALIPDDAKDAVDPALLRAAIMSALEVPKPQDQKLAALPFQVGDMAGLRLSNVMMGRAAMFTDGPSDSIDDPKQTFAVVAVVPYGASTLDFEKHMPFIEGQLKRQFPGAIVRTSRVRIEKGYPFAEIIYTRRLPGSDASAEGIAWAKLLGKNLALIIGQYRPGDQEAPARLKRLKDSIAIR